MFQGFTPETVDFMWGIRFNNEKPWFEAHKEDYLTTFYQPMKELCAQVYAAVSQAYPHEGLVSKVSRIYRDARRLHGRGPYKDNLWLSLERPSDSPFSSQPVFWFELMPEKYSYGMGYYSATPLTMAKFRHRLDTRPAPFEKLARQFQKQDRFTLDAAYYKKPKGDAGRLLNPWYNARSFSLCHESEHDSLLFTPQLADALIDAFSWLMPYYRYFLSLEGDPDPREP